MNETFMRRLTSSLPEQEAGVLARLLLSHNIELYARDPDHGDKYSYVDGQDACPGSLYVPAADYAQARRIIIRAGYEEFVSDEPEEKSDVKDSVQQIQEELRRRQKIQMIEWAVILTAVILYGLVRSRF